METINPWDRDLTLADFPVPGRKVEMHPGTDWWMQGDRFGVVTKVDTQNNLLTIRLDKSGKTIKVGPRLIDPGSFNPNRSLV